MMYLNWRLTLLFIVVMPFIGLVVRFVRNNGLDAS
jgi:ABC-type multidrug transport system fused ATPase/permease subunit